MTLFFNILFSPNNQNVVGALLYVFCLYLFLWNIIIIEKKKKYSVPIRLAYILSDNLDTCAINNMYINTLGEDNHPETI